MAHIIEMPKLSDDMTVGTIGRWLKKEGDVVKSGDALADIETDKATLELESHFEGILLKRFVGEGAKVSVDSPVCVIGKIGENIGTTDADSQEPLARTAYAVEIARAPVASRVISLTSEAKQMKDLPVLASSVAQVTASALAAPPTQRIRISPLARKLAKAKGIDPATVAGSGPRGRILQKDILAAEKNLLSALPSARPSSDPVVSAKPPVSGLAERLSDRVVPNSPMRAAIARRLVESKTQIPHFYLEVEIDAAPLLALRSQLNAALDREGLKISVNDFMLKASAFALLKVPEVNSSWEGSSVRLHAGAHVAFAVAIEDGLITPVIRDTEGKTLAAISAETKGLAARAKEKKLSPAEYTGSTFCVTNLGMMGITRFSAIINPPNVAILAVGATVKKPVIQADQIVIGERLTLTLSCDHRVVDGALGARFLNEVRDLLQAPVRLLLDPPTK